MKLTNFLPLVFLLVLTSCSTVNVVTDFDREVNFSLYDSYAFYKPGIDKTRISDLDKKRILRAIDRELSAKGMTKSDKPTLLITIFTKEQERVDVYNNGYGYGWGWNRGYYGGFYGNSAYYSTEGSLFIDLIDAKTNQLVWQGLGSAKLITSGDIDKKEARINEIVHEILAQFPPGTKE